MNFMSDRVFVDTNILIYAYDRAAGEKRARAKEVVKHLWDQGSGVLSTQVLQEFYVNITRKVAQPLSLTKARAILTTYLSWRVETITPLGVIQAAEIHERYQVSFWDAMIIVAAIQSGSQSILTEDLNHGQLIEGIRIENPLL
jgi:predicted nucleic acid-binding protein